MKHGQKSGDGPNSGRKARTYTATLPNGEVVTKKTFNIDTNTALIGCYQHDGQWHVSGVFREPIENSGQTFIPATKIN